MKFEPKSNGGSKNYVKLKGGESIQGVFRGDPYDYRQHWKDGKSFVCGDECPLCLDKQKSGFRFRINFVTKENGAYVAKVFEQGWNAYESLKALHESDYNLEKTIVKISRSGNGPNDTSYSIVPLPKWQVSEETEKQISEVKLNDVTNNQNAQDGAGFNEENSPF